MLPFMFVDLSIVQFVLIAIQHWLQDRSSFVAYYCKSLKIFQFELTKDSLPWGHFIVDQIFHFIWLWLVFNIYPILL